MSELEGENKVKDKNTIFDSSNIESKDKKELFTKVEGEEARKAAAEKAKAKAEKTAHENAIKEKAQEVEDAEKLDKKLKKAEQESMDGSVSKNKKRMRNILIIVIAIIILCIGGYFLAKFIGNQMDNIRLENDEKAKSYSLNIYKQAKEKQKSESLAASKQYFEEEIKKASEEQKIYLYIDYAMFVAEKTNDSKKAKELLESAMSLAKNDKEKTDVKAAYSSIGMILGDYTFDIYGSE